MIPNIQSLKKGDLIYLTAPAKAIEEEHIQFAKSFFEKEGFNVLISEHCLGQHNYFSGTDEERTQDFQFGLDNTEIKAIVCVRGGYGCIRILDRLQWAGFLQQPKWIVGFSDITLFHQRLQRYGIPSIHGSMPLNFKDNSKESLSTLISALKGEENSISFPFNKYNKTGISEGILVGGNLSILYSLLGTDDHNDYSNTILFIEDLAEHLYHIDRMMHAFEKARIFDRIKGLIIGGMTDLQDTTISFGHSIEEIILYQFKYRNLPIAFDFPAGHINDNRALILGKKCRLEVNEKGSELIYLQD